MSNIIGRFEIISQIAQSSATVYKALDSENQQTVALKVIRLEQLPEKDREALVKHVFDEAEQAKALSSHNIAALYGVGDEDGQLDHRQHDNERNGLNMNTHQLRTQPEKSETRTETELRKN